MKSKYNTYIRKLTKEDLIKGGIKEITEDCKVIFEDGRVLEKEEDFQRNKKGYFYFYVDELGPNGLSINKYYNVIDKQYRLIYLHRAMYAWYRNEVPENRVVDHKDNRHKTLYDNRLDNLQILTDDANLKKDAQYKCDLNKPLEEYERMLAYYTENYNKTTDKQYKKHCKDCIEQYQAMIRYWKAHKS